MTLLVSPDGREYNAGSVVEQQRLINGFGYKIKGKVFDPAQHDVKSVQEHLAKHPDDAERVLAAERLGQARVSILGKPDDPVG